MSFTPSESNHSNAYLKATDWLFQQFPSYQLIGSKAYKPTLNNIKQLLEWLGNPQNDLTFIHVAGSNGKGSTCSMLSSSLIEAGYKTGLYTSPHIEDYRERIRINGEMINEQSVIDFVDRIQEHSFDFDPSFFEMTFALSLLYFKNKDCDICVIETGLGGRLDATNIITPIISVITNISLEHTNILGDTLEEIADEKAGIIKDRVPVITGEQNPIILKRFEQKAMNVSASLTLTDQKIETPDNFPLLGGYQKDNYRTVRSTLKAIEDFNFNVSDLEVQKGLDRLTENSGFRGRLQQVSDSPKMILDVSHNPAGIKATLDTINEINQGKLHIIFGTSSDKDIPSIVSLFPTNASYSFTEFSNQRSATIKQLKSAAKEAGLKNANYFSTLIEARELVQNSAKQDDTILIIGSFFLIADFF